MLKIYTIKGYTCKEVSPGRGAIQYQLVDDLGQERTVTAIAKLGVIKKIKSVHPIHFRETPLVKALSEASINDEISVDFSDFNKHNPRVSSDRHKAKEKRLLDQISNAQAISTLDSFSLDPFRVLLLFIWAFIGLFALLVFKSFF